MANSVVPDDSVVSDLGLHCLLRPVRPNGLLRQYGLTLKVSIKIVADESIFFTIFQEKERWHFMWI